MKTHAIIPIFIPHAGCPHDCIFCNQKAITARTVSPTIEDTRAIIERNLATIKANPAIKTVEIAFFGGSFTGIPMEEQTAYLKTAKEYKDRGLVDLIHMSTRPDYIDEKILDNLKKWSADIIELGVQSFDPQVLAASARGHSAEVIAPAAELIKQYGFTLGIQLMIGLPEDSYEKCMYSVARTIELKPAIARLYPTVVLEDTGLYRMALQGEYKPLTEEEAVMTTKDMYRVLTDAGINVIRVGLKSTDIIRPEEGAIGAGSYHPAFRQLVEGQLAREDLEAQLKEAGIAPGPSSAAPVKADFTCHPESFSNMTGNRRANRLYFEKKYPSLNIRFKTDPSLEKGLYRVILK